MATYRPDFFDRSAERLRCRVCLTTIDFGDGTRSPEWLDDHVGERLGCPGCGLASRIPVLEESEWPERKDPDDPVAGVPVTERARAR